MERLITLSDIRAIRQVSINIDDEASINPFITGAQQIELRRILGIKFFNVFRKEIETTPTPPARATALLNGKKYLVDEGTDGEVEIEFPGIKPMLAYYALARAIPNLGKRVTRFAVVKKSTQFSEQVEKDELAAMVLDMRTNAKVYEEDLLYFLRNNLTTYPEFRTNCEAGQIQPAIRISTAGRAGRYE